jgi:cellulose synthase operon protein B
MSLSVVISIRERKPMFKLRYTLGLATVAFLSTTSLTLGQSLLEPVPMQAVQPVAPSASILSTRTQLDAMEIGADAQIVPFEQASDSLLLSGEDDVTVLTFNVSPEQFAAGGLLQVGYQNAVSVVPDASSIEMELNGKPIGKFFIASPNGVALETVQLSSADLKQGRNTLALRARQSHRVDCSLGATYELWTRISPKDSGFVSSAKPAFTRLQDLASVGKTDAGTTDLHLVIPTAATTDMINNASSLMQTLALYLNRTDVVVTVGDKPGTGPGIDVFVASNWSKSTAIPQQVLDAPSGISVRNGQTQDRASVILRANTQKELQAMLLDAVQGPMKDGIDTGMFAPKFGTIVAEQEKTYTLADAGYRTRTFAGRLSHTHFNLVMPADFYPAEYATLDLGLHAATSPGLDPNSQLLVRVNDKVVTSYPFSNTAGSQFDGKRIELPLRAFRPGVNAVEILAEVPKASDVACEPDQRDDSKPRFLLLENTSITIPKLARIGRLPDLAALSGKAYPFRDGNPFDLYVEHSDTQSVSAALTVLTRLSLAAGGPLAATVKLGKPDGTAAGNVLFLAATQSFADAGKTGKSSFPDMTIAKAALPLDIAGTDNIKTAAIVAPEPTANMVGEANPEDLLKAFQKNTKDAADDAPMSVTVQKLFSSATSGFGKWLRYEDPASEGENATNGNALLKISQIEAPAGTGTWTILQADSPRDLSIGVGRLVEPAVWNALDGGSADIKMASLALENHAAKTRYFTEMTDQSFGNYRRLLAAWFSDNFQIYVGLVLGLMGVFALWLGFRVPNKGVGADQ